MDETPYPPPAPGAPEPVAPAPPTTDYSAPVAPPAGYATPAAAPPKKNKTLVIVLVVVGLLLLCCIGVGVGGVLLFRSAGPDVVTSLEDEIKTDLDAEIGLTGSVDPAWDEFDPLPYDSSVYVEPSDRNVALVEEIMGVLYPDFVIDEMVAKPGSFDGDTYWMDDIFIAASLANDSNVRIVVPLYIQLEEGQAEGLSSTDPEGIEEGEALATTADGTEYIYYTDSLPGLLKGISDPDLVDLLAQVQTDFPDSLAEYVEIDGDDGYVSVTKWDAYPAYEQGFNLTYVRAGDGWEYTMSEPWAE